MLKITKFGGSSVADSTQFKKVKSIIESDPARKFVIVSASGKRNPKDNKITDLLYLCHAHIEYHVDYLPLFKMIFLLIQISNRNWLCLRWSCRSLV